MAPPSTLLAMLSVKVVSLTFRVTKPALTAAMAPPVVMTPPYGQLLRHNQQSMQPDVTR